MNAEPPAAGASSPELWLRFLSGPDIDALGISNAMHEEFVFDASGGQVTTSLLNYLMASAGDVPAIEVLEHHVPTPQLQDQMFAEAFRVLRPGGPFAGSDGVPSRTFRVMHFRDTYNPVHPDTLPDRLRRIGFTGVQVEVKNGEQRWRAIKPSL